jgi:uncharacterized membrane protein YkvA (DUF1232 family)
VPDSITLTCCSVQPAGDKPSAEFLKLVTMFIYPNLMRSTHLSLEFLRRISRRRSSAQPGVESIAEYIEWRATLLTPEYLAELRTDLPLLKLQFAALVVPHFPQLLQQLKVLVDFFEDTADGAFPAGSDASRKEIAFALRYAAKEIDIIPDFVPEIGYSDDSLIVRTVLIRAPGHFPRVLPFSQNSMVEAFSRLSSPGISSR